MIKFYQSKLKYCSLAIENHNNLKFTGYINTQQIAILSYKNFKKLKYVIQA